MTTKIQFTKEQLIKLYGPIIKTSALLQLVQPTMTSKSSDKIAVEGTLTDAAIHTRNGTKKAYSLDQFNTFDVHMADFYKLIALEDNEADDEQAMVAAIIEKMKSVISRTVDKALFPGLIAGSPYDLAEVEELTVNDTPESWLAVFSEIATSGYSANSAILDVTLKDELEAALTTGVATNGLREGIEDGAIVKGVKVYFRQGLGGKGIVFDSNAVAVAFKSGVTAREFKAENNIELQVLNQDALYVGFRVGVGVANPDAARFVVAGV